MTTTDTEPTRWRKKPVEIDAVQFTGHNYDRIASWMTYEPAEPHPVARVELFTDTTGDHRWRAIARNGEIVATSGKGYRNAAHARAMAERILPGVEIRDEETDRD
jgi:uncharacterized protein YegP (UPF0339 family)